MRKLYFTLLALLVCGLTQAQFIPAEKVTQERIAPDNYRINPDRTIDTIFTYFNRSTGFILWGSIDGGDIFGVCYTDVATNPPPDIRKVHDGVGNHYDGFGQAIDILEVLAWVAEGDKIGSADSIWGRVYNAGSDSMPTSLAGYGAITIDEVAASQNLTWSSIPITEGSGVVSNEFVVSWEFQGMDDTLGIVANDTTNGAGERRPKLLLTSDFGGTWKYVDEVWQGTWDLDVMLLPIFDDNPASSESNIEFNGVHILPSFPNPASGVTTIRYELDRIQDIRVKVFDLSARDLFDSGTQTMKPGTHETDVNVSDWAAGNYYYQVIAGGKTFSSRFTVTK